MSLFNLVQQNHAVRLTAYRFGKLTALVVAHVSRRRSDQTSNRVLFHILGHIDTDHSALGIEQVLGKSLSQLRFTNTSGAQEQEAANGTVRVGKACTVTANCACHSSHSFVLTNHAFAKLVFQINQLSHFALHHLGNGNARPRGHNLGDFVFANFFLEDRAVLLAIFQNLFCLSELLLQRRNSAVTQLGSAGQVAFAGGLLFLNLRSLNIGFQVLNADDNILFVLPERLLRIQRLTSSGNLLAESLQALTTRLIRFLHQSLLLNLHLSELALSQIDLFGHAVDFDT